MEFELHNQIAMNMDEFKLCNLEAMNNIIVNYDVLVYSNHVTMNITNYDISVSWNSTYL